MLDGPKERSSDAENGVEEDAQGHAGRPDPTTDTIPLRSINAVATHVPFIEDARTKVTAEMESMVLTGLATLVSHLSRVYILLN